MNITNYIPTQSMRSYTGIAITALAAFMLTACGGPKDGLTVLQEKRDSLKTVSTEVQAQLRELEVQIEQMDSTKKERIVHVTSMQLHPKRFAHYFVVQGVVEADHNAQLYPEAAGKILSINVKEGDRVTKGQTLMVMDSKVVANNMEEVKSRLELAETIYNKQKALWEKEIGSEIQYLEAKNNYQSLKQSLETLQAQKAMYTIMAPFSGVIDEVVPKVGEMANPAMPAFRLINMDDVYIKADVTEGYLGKIKAGDSVQVRFPSMGKDVWSSIERIGSFINPNNRTFKIRVNLKGSGIELRPNMLGEVKIRDYAADSAVVIPSRLIQMTPSGEEFLYSIDNSGEQTSAQKVMIKTGVSYMNETEVVTGLSGSEVLIDKGARSIKEGDAIAIGQEEAGE